eukprot:5143138-Prymnesium_polylepis.1
MSTVVVMSSGDIIGWRAGSSFISATSTSSGPSSVGLRGLPIPAFRPPPSPRGPGGAISRGMYPGSPGAISRGV